MESLIIGLGTTGITVLNSLYELVGDDENIKFLAVDSSKKGEAYDEACKLNKVDNYDFIYMSKSDSNYIEKEKIDFDFLYDGIKIEGQGAERDRVIGRYLFDNISHLKSENSLASKIKDEAIKMVDDNSGVINVWIINSLSGGTGSGIYPLVAMWARQKFVKQMGKTSIKLRIYGVGLYSFIKDLDSQAMNDEVKLEYYINSFAAVRELNKILWPEKTKNIKNIKLFGSDDEKLNFDAKHAFDKYFLVPFSENKSNDSYFKEIAKITANGIHYILNASENDIKSLGDSKLGILNAAEIGYDGDMLEKYINIKQEISTLEKSTKRLINDVPDKNTILEKAHKFYISKTKQKENFESENDKIKALQKFFDILIKEESDKNKLFRSGLKKYMKYYNKLTELSAIEDNKEKIKDCENEARELSRKLTTKSDGDVFHVNLALHSDKIDTILGNTDRSLSAMADKGYIDKEDLISEIDKMYKDVTIPFNIMGNKTKHDTDQDGLDDKIITVVSASDENKSLAKNGGKEGSTESQKSDQTKENTVNYQNRINIISYMLGANFKRLIPYKTMEDAYRNGKLDNYMKHKKGIGRIFAYPEFFLNDPRVMYAYPKYIDPDVELDFDKYWGDCPDDIKSELLTKQGIN